jgi:tRNA/rRNA methyltransferase
MAGTDSTRRAAPAGDEPAGPAVVLVEPQLGENVGMAARAMLNCGLSDLRLVRPRSWPSDKAVAAASGADRILDAARVFGSVAAAIADLNRVYATTARERGMTIRVVTPRQAATEMRAYAKKGDRIGVLFGKEAKGLLNEEVVQADTVIMAPLNPGFQSLNLAQAVFAIGYEWLMAADTTPASALRMPLKTRPATKAELLGLFEHLESELDACGFLKLKHKRPVMVRNLRNMFQRAGLTEQEVRTLRGVIACLTGRPARRKKP